MFQLCQPPLGGTLGADAGASLGDLHGSLSTALLGSRPLPGQETHPVNTLSKYLAKTNLKAVPVWFFLEPRTTAGKEPLIHREFLPLTEVWAKFGGDKPGGNAAGDQGVSPVRWGPPAVCLLQLPRLGLTFWGLRRGARGNLHD